MEDPGHGLRVALKYSAAPGSEHENIALVALCQTQDLCAALAEYRFNLRDVFEFLLTDYPGIRCRTRDKVDQVEIFQKRAVVVAKDRAARRVNHPDVLDKIS